MGFKPAKFIKELNKYIPEIQKSNETFNNYLQTNKKSYKDGKIDKKTKELIALSISLTIKCPYCIAFHVKRALKIGITKDEMLEAAAVAIDMGGSPAVTYTTMMLKAIEEFQSEKEE